MIILADVLVDLPAMTLQEISLVVGGIAAMVAAIIGTVIPLAYWFLRLALGKEFVSKKQFYASEKSMREDLAKQKGLQDQSDGKTAQLLHQMKELNTNIGALSETVKENTNSTKQFSIDIAVLKDRTKREAT